MFNINYLLILGSVLVIVIGQVLFKWAAINLRVGGRDFLEILTDNYRPIAMAAAAVALYGISTIAWIQALRTIPLVVAFSFNALAFVLVPAASLVIFEEQLPRYFFVGLPLIVVGIILLSLK